MRVLSVAVVLLGSAFLVHWLVWRLAMPRRQTAALLAIFLAVLAVGIPLAVRGIPAPELALHGPWECLHVAIVHVAVALAYVVVYSALEERSPSMTILSFVNEAGAAGRSREEIARVLRGASPVEIRLDAAVRDRMLAETGGLCTLTPKGRAWASSYEWLRNFLGFTRGG
jgi:hypothetical protein